MPKQLRWEIKKDLDKSLISIETAKLKMLRYSEIYKEHGHEDFAERFIIVAGLLVTAYEELKKIRDDI